MKLSTNTITDNKLPIKVQRGNAVPHSPTTNLIHHNDKIGQWLGTKCSVVPIRKTRAGKNTHWNENKQYLITIGLEQIRVIQIASNVGHHTHRQPIQRTYYTQHHLAILPASAM